MAQKLAFEKKLKDAKYILLHFADFLGRFRGRTIPASELPKAVVDGVGFDGSSIPACTTIEQSDMIMLPDPTTACMLPKYFYQRPVGALTCHIITPERKLHTTDSRNISIKHTQKLHQQGLEPTAAAELEFYLVKIENGQIVSVESHVKENPRYFDIAPDRDVTETYRMDLSDALNTVGIQVERQHHEVGPAQNEITFKYSSPTKTADNIIRYKFIAKAIAHVKYGWTATFMPKPWPDKAGSGMHVHLGLFERKTRRNLFFDAKEYANISQKCRYFIGGLKTHAKALSAIVAPTVNSYKRLVPGYEAPVYICWNRRNRSALIRVPEYFPHAEKETRIEFRCPDALCNPYLAYATLFEAGMDGIKKKIDCGDPVEANAYHMNSAQRRRLGIKELPRSLDEALEEWKSDDICARAIGKENAEVYFELKMKEWKEYKTHASRITNEVTSWELEKYIYY